jgi:alanine racemase
MKEVSRRGFLTVAGTAPLALAVPRDFLTFRVTKPAGSIERLDPWIELNLDHLAWNLSQVRRRVNNRPVMVVIKANAYGHGLVGIARFLEAQNVRHFAVGKVQEAVSLRESGLRSTILNFGPFSEEEAAQLVELDVSQSVYTGAIDLLARAARRLNKRAKVHVKIDTGLGRVGVPYYEALPLIERIASIPEILIQGIFTTFTEDPDFDRVQLERFLQVCAAAAERPAVQPSRLSPSPFSTWSDRETRSTVWNPSPTWISGRSCR